MGKWNEECHCLRCVYDRYVLMPHANKHFAGLLLEEAIKEAKLEAECRRGLSKRTIDEVMKGIGRGRMKENG